MPKKKKPTAPGTDAAGNKAPPNKRKPEKRARRTTDEQDRARLAASHETRRERAKLWRTAFLEALRREKSVTKACEAAGLSRKTAYAYRDRDETFAEEWDECLETVRDDLEAGAMKRAVEGWLEPVYYKGNAVGTVRKFSAALTIFMLKCHRPDRYNLFFPEDDGGEGTPEQRATKVRAALRAMRGSVPTAPERTDGDGGDGGDGEA